MSKLEQLIQELCPDGVIFSNLSEVLTIRNGKDYKSFAEGDIPVYGSGGIMTYIDTAAYEKTSVLIPRKGSLDKLYYVDIPFWTVDTIFYTEIDETKVLPRYVFYYLQSQHLERLNKAGGVPSLTQAELNRVKIPVPPLPVQSEIVRILDSFTELTNELNKALEAELTARRKQYAYYRDELLVEPKDGIEMQFADIFEFQNGFAFKSALFRESGHPILRITNIQEQRIDTENLVYFSPDDYKENLESFIVYPGDIIVAMSGATTGKIGVNDTDKKYYLNQRVGKFRPRENMIHKRYLYHLLLQNSNKLLEISLGSGAQPNLSSEKLKKLTAKIPPLFEQKRIANILDKLDALCNDLTSGLPVEIEARQKQYEYYRDKLLSFKAVG